MDIQLTAHFARQHGLVTSAQVSAAGGTRRMVHNRLASGRWARVGGGVYRLAGAPVTWEQRALAACLIAGPGAVVSHQAAAFLLGVSGFRAGRLHVTVEPTGSARNPLGVVHRAALGPRERSKRHGLPVTSPARTLVDVARSVSGEMLEEAVDDVLCRRLVSLDRLQRAAEIAGGPKALRAVLAAWSPGALPGSVAEMDVVRQLLAAGLPGPERQFWLAEAHARIDLAYPSERIAIELDSFRWHAGRRAFETDRSRGNRIVAAGWQLLRATRNDPGSVTTAAAALMQRRAA